MIALTIVLSSVTNCYASKVIEPYKKHTGRKSYCVKLSDEQARVIDTTKFKCSPARIDRYWPWYMYWWGEKLADLMESYNQTGRIEIRLLD